MNRLIIESLLIFIIVYLLFELLNKYIEVDRIIILILSVVIASIYYMKRLNNVEEHLENIEEPSNNIEIEDKNIKIEGDFNIVQSNGNDVKQPEEIKEKIDEKKEEIEEKIEENKEKIEKKKEEIDEKIEENKDEIEKKKEEIEEKIEDEKPEKIVIEQTNKPKFIINNKNNDGSLQYFSDKNLQKLKKGKAYDYTFTNHVNNNIDKQNTRNQFQTEDDDFNVNGHSNVPEKLEDISIEGLKDPTVITNENHYNQYGGYIDANTLYVPRDYKYTDDDYGWNFIPPLRWIDLPDQNAPRVPLCVSANGNCRVNASLTTGYPITVKTWNESRKVMGPSHIDTNYIKNHLNSTNPPEKIIS